jgi:hypothetical protein
VGTIGALAVAWFLYRRQRKEERADFEESLAHERDLFKQSLAHDRQLFQENLTNDRKIRRDEDRARRRERDESERRERLNVLEGLFTECSLNIDAIAMMARDEAHQFPLRHQALDQALSSLDSLPPDLSTQLLSLSLFIDRYNAIDPVRFNTRFRGETLMDVNKPLVNSYLTLEKMLRGQAKSEDGDPVA